MKKVLVSGGAGFIGSYVVDELINRGYEPIIFDHHDRKDYREGVELFVGDVRDEVALTEAAAHSDGIIHLAAVLGTQETVKNPRPAAQSNLMGGLNFLEACSQYDLPGTYIAVGNHWMNNPYSITKNMIERFTHMYNKDRGTRVNIVRAVNAYGARQLAVAPFAHGKVRKITPSFVCRALCDMDIEIYGDGSQVSDMVYVGDVAKALVTSLEYADRGEVFDYAVETGDGAKKTVKEVAELIIELSGSKSQIKYLPMRPGEVAGAEVFANSSTMELIGMNIYDLVPLEEGMARTIQWFREMEGTTWEKPNAL